MSPEEIQALREEAMSYDDLRLVHLCDALEQAQADIELLKKALETIKNNLSTWVYHDRMSGGMGQTIEALIDVALKGGASE